MQSNSAEIQILKEGWTNTLYGIILHLYLWQPYMVDRDWSFITVTTFTDLALSLSQLSAKTPNFKLVKSTHPMRMKKQNSLS